jgi:hypothetical protein
VHIQNRMSSKNLYHLAPYLLDKTRQEIKLRELALIIPGIMAISELAFTRYTVQYTVHNIKLGLCYDSCNNAMDNQCIMQ